MSLTLSRLIAAATLLLALFAVFWGWTIYSVYFAGGRTVLDRPEPSDGVDIVEITNGFHAIQGAGGNITVSVGADGVLVVDTGYREMSEAVIAAIRSVSNAKVVTIVNTHFHHDHAEGNSVVGETATETIAQENSLTHMKSLFGNPYTEADLPTLTFEDRHTFHFNGQDVELVHAPQAHTDSDAIVVFRPANVIAAGDTLMTDALPYFSLGTGATLDGHLAGQDLLLALADSQTHIVPGHGTLTNRETLIEIHDDLKAVRDRLATLKSWGVPRKARILFHPLAGWPKSRQLDGDWERFWTSIAWDSLP